MAHDSHDDAPDSQPAPHDAESPAPLGRDDSDVGELSEFRHSHRKRILTIVGLVVAMVLSVLVGQWHSTWRAIVLDVRGDQMFLGYAKKPPEWVEGRLTDPGHIVAKESWSWDAAPAAVALDDEALVALYQRYTKEYTGTVVELRNAVAPGSFPMAIIHTDTGGREYVNLVDTVLFGVELNRRVEKASGAWDPRLLPKGAPGPLPAPPAPEPGTTPPAPAVPPAALPPDGAKPPVVPPAPEAAPAPPATPPTP